VQHVQDSAGCMGMGIIMLYHDSPYDHAGMLSHDSGMSVLHSFIVMLCIGSDVILSVHVKEWWLTMLYCSHCL